MYIREASDRRYKEHFRQHVELFMSDLDYKLDYEFDFVLDISMEGGGIFFRVPLNRRKNRERGHLTPYLRISSGVLSWMKFLSGAEDLDKLYRKGDIRALGDLHLLGVLSLAMKQYCRNHDNDLTGDGYQ